MALATASLRRSVVNQYGELDHDAAEDLTRELTDAFVESAEGREFDGYFVSFVMTWASRYLGESPAAMSPDTFRDCVFDGIPRKYSCQASEAPHIIDELRAFCRFLERELQHPDARKCLDVLDDSAAKQLHDKLADPRNFDMAKSFMMGGSGGANIPSEEEIERLLSQQGSSLPALSPIQRRLVNRGAKSRRKMQKSSRRRNR